MKLKILMIATSMVVLASCGPSFRVTDQSGVGIKPPTAVNDAFTNQYPTAGGVTWSAYDAVNLPIDWELTGWPAMDQNDYAVVFNLNDDKYYAWYDPEGNWIGTVYAMSDFKTLPVPVSSMINDKYPGYTITSVTNEMQKDRMAYEIQLKNGDTKAKLLVDSNGSIIKEKTK
ncbi:MAG TPA: PepSY-like domain-containing protein [Chitinophagaceae bacterium]|nr:PepSY-like domain-containing protein [Chitinophagaceae bacterium]